MNKKSYINPSIEVVAIDAQSHLMEITGAVNAGSDNFSDDLHVGGTTNDADSRGNSDWD